MEEHLSRLQPAAWSREVRKMPPTRAPHYSGSVIPWKAKPLSLRFPAEREPQWENKYMPGAIQKLAIQFWKKTKLGLASSHDGYFSAKATGYSIANIYGNLSEKATAPHSSTLAWRIPWTEEPGRLPSMGSLKVRHWATSLSLFTFMHWRRKWQPTPVFLPGESQGWVSLAGCRLWGRTELDTTEVT